MLEYDALLLVPWDEFKVRPDVRRDKREATPTWAILETSARKLVGLARRPAGNRSIWSRWFRRERLAVYESEDEPLVCTLHRGFGWSRVWDVCDADGHIIGRIAKSGLRGSLNRLLVPVRRLDQSATDFRDQQGRMWATITPQGNERQLSFATESKSDPLARMLILGAALIDFA